MKGSRTPDSKKEELKAVLYMNPEITQRELAKTVNMPLTTVHQLYNEVKETDEYEQARTIKKQEFINNAWEVVQKALLLTNKRFTKALDDEEAIEQLIGAIQDHALTVAEKKTLVTRLNGLQMNNIRDIAITLGTIYDKQALASGEPTTITESRKAIPELVKDTEAMLQELKQLTGS